MSTSFTRRTFTAGIGLYALLLPRLASGQDAAPRKVRVVTAHPAAFALASALTKGSEIAVEAVQPAKLPATRLTSYLAGRGKAALADVARKADAVVTFRSFWPDDPLYPHARRTNIRIVEIDAGRPLDGALPGLAIAEPRDDGAVYKALDLQPMPATGEGAAPWLAPTGMGRMADVLAADLSRLEPSSAGTVAANLAGLKRQLLSLKAEADVALAGADDLTAVALSPHFGYLAADLGIDLRASITAAPAEWTPERSEKLPPGSRTTPSRPSFSTPRRTRASRWRSRPQTAGLPSSLPSRARPTIPRPRSGPISGRWPTSSGGNPDECGSP
jgi:hypothetical protein